MTAQAAKRRKPKAGEMEVRSVSIEPADNGYTVETYYRLKDGYQEICMYPDSDRSVFTDVAAMTKHVAGVFGRD